MNMDWQIDCVVSEDNIFPGMIDAHTHGLNKHGLPELQFTLAYDPKTIGYIINTVAEKLIEGGEKPTERQVIEGVFKDGALLRLHYVTEDRNLVRIVIQDNTFRFPENSIEYPYNLQANDPYISSFRELCVKEKRGDFDCEHYWLY